jgi:hypothetical protein
MCPTLNETVGAQTSVAGQATGSGVVDATVVNQPETSATGGTEKPAKKGWELMVPDGATAEVDPVKPPAQPKVKKVKKEVTGEEGKKPKAKKPATEGEESAEDKLVRPPMEQIHRDVERIILDSKVAGHQVKKLEYKCGKLIYGLGCDDGKDFRVIALKARKKTKSVAGKSRCIYYFGISDDHTAVLKAIAGTKSTNFGRCSVQCKRPIELVIDKASYKEAFGQNVDNIVSAVTKLVKITCEQKTAEYEALQTKTKEKAEAKVAKTAKKEKAAALKKEAIEKATAKKAAEAGKAAGKTE